MKGAGPFILQRKVVYGDGLKMFVPCPVSQERVQLACASERAQQVKVFAMQT